MCERRLAGGVAVTLERSFYAVAFDTMGGQATIWSCAAYLNDNTSSIYMYIQLPLSFRRSVIGVCLLILATYIRQKG
jgi:ABC-type sulfate transport system permease component